MLIDRVLQCHLGFRAQISAWASRVDVCRADFRAQGGLVFSCQWTRELIRNGFCRTASFFNWRSTVLLVNFFEPSQAVTARVVIEALQGTYPEPRRLAYTFARPAPQLSCTTNTPAGLTALGHSWWLVTVLPTTRLECEDVKAAQNLQFTMRAIGEYGLRLLHVGAMHNCCPLRS